MDKTLIKGLEILTFVVEQPDGARLIDVAAAIGLTKSNAHRSLDTLRAAGLLQQNPRSKIYSASIRVWELGMKVIDRLDIRSVASGALQLLAQQSRETVHLAILDGMEVVYVDKVDSPEPVKAYSRLGGRGPAHCVATGKALLSRLSDPELDRLLVDLPRHSRFTITDPRQLRDQLADIRESGIAINRGEWRDGVWGIAAPVQHLSGQALAAIGVSGPDFRISPAARVKQLRNFVREAAANIERELNSNQVPSPAHEGHR